MPGCWDTEAPAAPEVTASELAKPSSVSDIRRFTWGNEAKASEKTAATPLMASKWHEDAIGDSDGLEYRPWVPFAGVIDDFRRRGKHYRSDWSDAFRSGQTISAGVFIFVAAFSSTLATGNLCYKMTNGNMGVSEYLIMNSLAGIVYSFIGCQPYMVLRPTGPITMLILRLYQVSMGMDLNFYTFFATTGVWICFFMTLVAAFELSRFTRLLTRFTHEIFASFVCSGYIVDGLRAIFADFFPTGDVPILIQGGGVATQEIKVWHATSPLEQASHGLCALILAVSVVVITLILFEAPQSIIAVQRVRHILHQYSLAFAILAATLVAHYSLSGAFHIEYINMPGASTTNPLRPWIVGLGTSTREWLLACPCGLMVVLFMFQDQNISSALTQEKASNLVKGSYYHSTIFLVGIFSAVGALFGLPFVTGCLPHSPMLVKAATKLPNPSDHSEWAEELRRKRPVLETRVVPLINYTLMGITLLFPDLIQYVPAAVVNGTLIFVGFKGLSNLQLFERLMLIISEPRMYPPHRFDKDSHHLKMHCYTLIQFGCWAMCWVIDHQLGIIFPIWILCLAPIRMFLIPMFFTPQELAALDGHE